jgi:serine/threonine protein phosphatase PrpC
LIHFATATESGGRDEDRIALRETPNGIVLILADGAGGVGGGAAAAQTVCDLLERISLEARRSPLDWVAALQKADRAMMTSAEGGLTTAIALETSGTTVFGASVGDSGAWMIDGNGIVDLTQHQFRKPLLGDGEAYPVPFGPIAVRGRLLVATDGLLKYAPRAELARCALEGPVEKAVPCLIDSVRLRSGSLQDDVAVAVIELAE